MKRGWRTDRSPPGLHVWRRVESPHPALETTTQQADHPGCDSVDCLLAARGSENDSEPEMRRPPSLHFETDMSTDVVSREAKPMVGVRPLCSPVFGKVRLEMNHL